MAKQHGHFPKFDVTRESMETPTKRTKPNRTWSDRDKAVHACLREAIAKREEERKKNKPKFNTTLQRVNVKKDWGCADGKKRYDDFWGAISNIEDTYLRLSVQQRHIVEEFVRCVF